MVSETVATHGPNEEVKCKNCGAVIRRNEAFLVREKLLCELCYDGNVPSWDRRPEHAIGFVAPVIAAAPVSEGHGGVHEGVRRDTKEEDSDPDNPIGVRGWLALFVGLLIYPPALAIILNLIAFVRR